MAHLNRPRESQVLPPPPDPGTWWSRRLRSWMACAHTLRDRLPLACLLCEARASGGLCADCRLAVCASMVSKPRCPRCALGHADGAAAFHMQGRCPDCSDWSPALHCVFAAFDYEWPGDLLIQRLKLQGRLACAPVLAHMMASRLPSIPGSNLVVTAVPASRPSLLLRGYNPAAEIGRALARRLGVPWRPGLVCRAKGSSHQKGLSRQGRRSEVQGLYQCTADMSGRQILVVDDVMTTGSTLDAIAVAMKARGALDVWGVVAARTGLDPLHRANAPAQDASVHDPAAAQ